MLRPRQVAIWIVAATLVAACGEADPAGEAPDPVTPIPTGNGPTVGEIEPGLQALVEAAVADLAARLGVAPADITVVSAVPVTWGDASLGCPQPGMRYAQVPQDGARIELRHQGTNYPYHSGGARPTPFLCEQKPDKGQPTEGGIGDPVT